MQPFIHLFTYNMSCASCYLEQLLAARELKQLREEGSCVRQLCDEPLVQLHRKALQGWGSLPFKPPGRPS